MRFFGTSGLDHIAARAPYFDVYFMIILYEGRLSKGPAGLETPRGPRIRKYKRQKKLFG